LFFNNNHFPTPLSNIQCGYYSTLSITLSLSLSLYIYIYICIVFNQQPIIIIISIILFSVINLPLLGYHYDSQSAVPVQSSIILPPSLPPLHISFLVKVNPSSDFMSNNQIVSYLSLLLLHTNPNKTHIFPLSLFHSITDLIQLKLFILIQ
jgi:hypothetical protein